jgi:hypothetical protein
MTAVEYIELRAARTDLITRVATRTSDFDALLTNSRSSGRFDDR